MRGVGTHGVEGHAADDADEEADRTACGGFLLKGVDKVVAAGALQYIIRGRGKSCSRRHSSGGRPGSSVESRVRGGAGVRWRP